MYYLTQICAIPYVYRVSFRIFHEGSKLAFLNNWGAPLFFSIVQVSLNFLFSIHITTATSISAYMDLLATRSVQVHASIWSC